MDTLLSIGVVIVVVVIAAWLILNDSAPYPYDGDL